MARILYGIFAEDIRVERGGLMTAVGIFGAQLVVPKVPVALPKFSFLAGFENFAREEVRLTVRISAPGRSTVGPPDGTFRSESHCLNLTLSPYEILSEGDIVFEVKIHGQEPVRFTLRVKVAQR